MSNELLRIHDENNNCDLVAVANPMGNFHMSTYAEMQDGTLKPVDGWYLFSKMIEKLGQGGGGGDNVDMIISCDTDGHFVIESGSFELIHEKMGNGAMPKIVYVGPTDGTPNDYELSYKVSGNAGSLEYDNQIFIYFSNQFTLHVDTDNNVYAADNS